MAARKSTNVISKDFVIFILIIGIVALMTYVLTYNAITAKFNQQVGGYPIEKQDSLLPLTN